MVQNPRLGFGEPQTLGGGSGCGGCLETAHRIYEHPGPLPLDSLRFGIIAMHTIVVLTRCQDIRNNKSRESTVFQTLHGRSTTCWSARRFAGSCPGRYAAAANEFVCALPGAGAATSANRQTFIAYLVLPRP